MEKYDDKDDNCDEQQAGRQNIMTMEGGGILPETHSGASFMRQCSSETENSIHIHHQHIGDEDFEHYEWRR